MSTEYSEDRLVQQTTADYLRDALGWTSIYAYNDETYGDAGTLGRADQNQVVLTRYLRLKLTEFNPGLPLEVYNEAIERLTSADASKTLLQMNQDFYTLHREGLPITYRVATPGGGSEERTARLRLFDFNTPTNNHFLAVRELWVQGTVYRRRPDIIGFVNGLPLVFIELKAHHRNVRLAYEKNLSDYKNSIPHLFHHNALILLSNGREGRIGSLTSRYEHFNEWKRLAEEETGRVDWETMLRGMLTRDNLIDLLENFIVFDSSSGETRKVIARNHQYLGVNRAVGAARSRAVTDGKLGVFWHTQGSGKSYSMVFMARKIGRRLPGNFTFLVVTDRVELDRQIYKTFAGTGAVSEPPQSVRAKDGDHLRRLLGENHSYLFTLIHKFHQEVRAPYSTRSDIIVISDEAHRTQYGRLARNMRAALPNAAYIGFTGTPLIGGPEDALTKEVFGDYISTYDFRRAVEDGATVPLYYDNRGEKLKITTEDLNERVAAILDDADLEEEQEAKVRRQLAQEYNIITAPERLDAIAEDLVAHFIERWQTGKAMLICLDKPTTVKMYDRIASLWQQAIRDQRRVVRQAEDEQAESEAKALLDWLEETQIRVVVSEEQNEVNRFQEWGLNIELHRKRMKDNDLEEDFKNPNHPFRLVIVCAMWLTGFDVESLSTLYIDKPMKRHTVMQAIARANRVYSGKSNGLIVDYNGLLKSLRRALAVYATGDPNSGSGSAIDPVQPPEVLVAEYAAAIQSCVDFLAQQGFELARLVEALGMDKLAAIDAGVNAACVNDRVRAQFEILASDALALSRSLTGNSAARPYTRQINAIEAVYKALPGPVDKGDVGEVLAEVRDVIYEAVGVQRSDREPGVESDNIYDISAINFERLRAEFARVSNKNTTVQSVKERVETKLEQMVQRNPGQQRQDLLARYQAIIADYNHETDRVTIEQTFDALMKLLEDLDEEESRAVREGLTEEYLAIFDLLCAEKDNLDTRSRNRIKTLAQSLIDAIKDQIQPIDNWRDKNTTRSQLQTFIFDYLWDEKNGLPADTFEMHEIQPLAVRVYLHVYERYPSVAGSVYAVA